MWVGYKYLMIYQYQSLSYVFKILIKCLSCSIMTPETSKTSTHSLMKWDDEQNYFFAQNLQRASSMWLTLTAINWKMHQWLEIVNTLNQNKLTRRGPSTICNPRFIGVRNIMKLNGPGHWPQPLEQRSYICMILQSCIQIHTHSFKVW